jgi:hypothetical protein
MVAGFKSERWPTSNRYPWPASVGIRIEQNIGEGFAGELAPLDALLFVKLVSVVTLFDGAASKLFDGLPASASREL